MWVSVGEEQGGAQAALPVDATGQDSRGMPVESGADTRFSSVPSVSRV